MAKLLLLLLPALRSFVVALIESVICDVFKFMRKCRASKIDFASQTLIELPGIEQLELDFLFRNSWHSRGKKLSAPNRQT
jgi:hypothetical protein